MTDDSVSRILNPPGGGLKSLQAKLELAQRQEAQDVRFVTAVTTSLVLVFALFLTYPQHQDNPLTKKTGLSLTENGFIEIPSSNPNVRIFK